MTRRVVKRLEREKLDSAPLSALFVKQRENDGALSGKYDLDRTHIMVARKGLI